MSSRRQGRILAFQTLYAWEAVKARFKSASEKQEILENLLTFSWLEDKKSEWLYEETQLFSRLLITGSIENLEKIDDIIKSHLEHWNFSRVSRVDLAILRISVYQLLFQRDMSAPIVISEAIAIAKIFGEEKSYGFVNGVLDGIRKTVENGEHEEEGAFQKRFA
ncbi:MAG: transcription antitermination factor NusB [Treponema sp.]|jgi:N utilization substance protein B|nr:transcription antitermination factor NusB [Treponema sp.]